MAKSRLGMLRFFVSAPWAADTPWIEVRDVIRERMQTQVREFQGSLLALVELARSVRESLGGSLTLL